MIEIYTDGSCRNNGKPNSVGVYAYGIVDDTGKDFRTIYSGPPVFDTTNQRMELGAIYSACESARRGAGSFESIHIYTDSAYFHNCVTQKWYESWIKNDWKNSKKQPVANRDLWELLIPFFSDARFEFHKVPGHANNKLNNKIDEIVQAETKFAMEHRDEYF